MLFIKCIEVRVVHSLFTLGTDIFESQLGVNEESWTFQVENPIPGAWCLSHPVQRSFSLVTWQWPTSQHYCNSCGEGPQLSSSWHGPQLYKTVGNTNDLNFDLLVVFPKLPVTIVAGISVSNTSLLTPWLGQSQDLSSITWFKMGFYNISDMYPGSVQES